MFAKLRNRVGTSTATALLALALSPTGASAAAPTIPLSTFSAVTTDSATLEADLNPQGKATFYRFEYGLSDCSVGPCTPTAKAQIPSGAVVRVKAQVEGLTPGTAYHFRALAENGEGKAEAPDQTFTTHLLPPVFGPCPNDFFRVENPMAASIEHSSSNLSDCRAYEQATPMEKNAGDISGTVNFVKAALEGGKVTFLSSSGVPGGEGSQELPVYLGTRDKGQWSTQGLLPPGDTGQRARVIGWTPDFSWSFSQATKLGTPQLTTFLARSSTGAPLEKIVDYTPNFAPQFADVSEDGSLVLFEAQAKLLPGAIEGKSNVYLWERESKALSLVGVLNNGETPSKGALAGSYDWIKGTTPQSLSEGAAARSYYTQEQHVLSTEGSAYFTAAGTGQLYLRRNPTEAQSPLDGEGKCTDPAKACTLNVSASQKINGTGPGGTDPAGTRPAAFMGASADGSKAFFTSSEKLTNDANTGPEQEPAAIARAEIDGKNADLDFLFASASGIAIDATYIYWANPPAGTIGRVKLDGTDIKEDFITGAGNPQWVAVDAGHVYWTNAGAEEKDGEGTIGRAEIDGNNLELDFIKGASKPQGIAINAPHVYWANAGSKAIARAKIDGTGVDLKCRQLNAPEFPQGVALNATHVYWTTNNPDAFVSRANLDCSNEIFVGDGDKTVEARGIALDGSHVYWTRQGKETIGRAKLDLTNPEREFINDADKAKGLAADGVHLYWSAGQNIPNPGNELYRYDSDTGDLTDLAVDEASKEGLDAQGVLAVSNDGSHVYFAANGVSEGVGNSPNANGENAAPGSCDSNVGTPSGSCSLYLWREGDVDFIARLDAGGSGVQTDAANWAGTPSGIFPDTNFQKTARLSADGETLLFRSQRQLTAYENEGTAQLYRYQAGDAGPSCVSCNPTGEAPKGAPRFGTIFPAVLLPTPPASITSRNLSSDGNRVFFETPDALVGADTNGLKGCPPTGSELQAFPACLDVYMWEAQGTGSCESDVQGGGCLYLLSTGKGSEPALLADASGSGDDALFFTRSRLVGQDQDELIDVYDARVGGGLSAQNQLPVDPCVSVEGCHQGTKPPPTFESPGTPKFTGPADPPPKHKAGCPKGKRAVRAKGRTRCVPKRSKGQQRKRKQGRAGVR